MSNDIWNIISSALQERISPIAYNTWFIDCEMIDLTESSLILHTPNSFKKDIICSRYNAILEEILQDLFSAHITISVLAGDEIIEYREKKPSDDPFDTLFADYTFENFIVGTSNQFAHSVARAVSKNPGDSRYNPLLIYGNSGLGKTHLLMAVGHCIHDAFPDKKIIYVKGEDFTNDLIVSLQHHAMENFRQRYRNADLLLMDDIQFISGKQSTQEEFFHTFDALHQIGRQIVLTSDRPPRDMPTLENRIMTRLEGGIMVDVQPPDLETRIAIARSKAMHLGMFLPDDVLNFIAETITSNVRQIEGVIKRLTAFKEIQGQEIDIENAKRAIRDVFQSGAYNPTPDIIISETARYFGITEDMIKGSSRKSEIMDARHTAIYLCRNLTNLSLEDIGQQFGGRNHSTILASINKIEEYLKTDPKFPNVIRDITSNINSKN